MLVLSPGFFYNRWIMIFEENRDFGESALAVDVFEDISHLSTRDRISRAAFLLGNVLGDVNRLSETRRITDELTRMLMPTIVDGLPIQVHGFDRYLPPVTPLADGPRLEDEEVEDWLDGAELDANIRLALAKDLVQMSLRLTDRQLLRAIKESHQTTLRYQATLYDGEE
jgi:hypothetical protein